MRQRSSYPKTFKAQVAQECRQPVGHSFRRRHQHGINANVIRKWLPIYLDRPPACRHSCRYKRLPGGRLKKRR